MYNEAMINMTEDKDKDILVNGQELVLRDFMSIGDVYEQIDILVAGILETQEAVRLLCKEISEMKQNREKFEDVTKSLIKSLGSLGNRLLEKRVVVDALYGRATTTNFNDYCKAMKKRVNDIGVI